MNVMEQLSAVDAVRERMHVSYEKAKKALEATGWNELEAIILLEREAQAGNRVIWTRGANWLDKVKELIHKGNVTRIKVKQGEKVLAEFPVTVGVVGAAIAPYLAVLGALAALAGRCRIEIEQRDESVLAGSDDQSADAN